MCTGPMHKSAVVRDNVAMRRAAFLPVVLITLCASAAPTAISAVPPPVHPPPWPRADATPIGSGIGFKEYLRQDTPRIYYAPRLPRANSWTQYLRPAHQALLRHLNFSRYAVLAIFVPESYPLQSGVPIGVGAVWLMPAPGGLTAALVAKSPCAPGPLIGSCVALGGHYSYVLAKIRKSSIPYRVKRLYIAPLS
jgi:hypothetical protein